MLGPVYSSPSYESPVYESEVYAPTQAPPGRYRVYGSPVYDSKAYFSEVYGLPEPIPPTVDLGRFRLGDTVGISLEFDTAQALVSIRVSGPDGFSAFYLAPSIDGGLTFDLSLFLGEGFPLGVYTATTPLDIYTFEVVPSGDPRGAIIALASQRSVSGWAVLAQTESGILVLGRNPRL